MFVYKAVKLTYNPHSNPTKMLENGADFDTNILVIDIYWCKYASKRIFSVANVGWSI